MGLVDRFVQHSKISGLMSESVNNGCPGNIRSESASPQLTDICQDGS
jgi:hypothetical protein